MTPKLKRVFVGCALLLVIVAGAVGWVAFYAHHEHVLPRSPLEFTLKSGSSLTGAAQQMAAAGAVERPQLFIWLARLLGAAEKIKAGNYELESPVSPLALLHKITRGDVTLTSLTFVEGWTFAQMRRALDANAAVRHDTRDLSEREILDRLGMKTAAAAEGWFFPSTYHFSSGTSDLAILRRAHELMRMHLQAEWAARSASVPLATPYEALILASIIEKETGKPEERPLIAAVFTNRLRAGMRLQTDPSVIYGLGERFDGNLRRRDLEQDTPYNTYTRAGLPPTPIAMPGLASIRAALNPADSDILYFVSKGDGTSHFSSSFVEHDRAVTKYQRNGKR